MGLSHYGQVSVIIKNQPNIFFGMGVTKAGTSWLYKYLAGHPDCAVKAIKELHFFDKIEKQATSKHMQKLKLRSDYLRARLQDGTRTSARLKKQIQDIEEYLPVLKSKDVDQYVNYLTAKTTKEDLAVDITPAYSLLQPQTLEQLVLLSTKSKFLIILRDPVDRIWSNIRMVLRRQSTVMTDLLERRDILLEAVISGNVEPILARGDYAGIITRLEAAIPRQRLKMVFFEDLFQSESIEKICQFLGIRSHAGDFNKHVHEGIHLKLPSHMKERLSTLLAPQYEFVQDHFGAVPERWMENS